MTRDEAIGRIKARFDKWALDDEDMKAIQTLIPELAESEDERIRKELKEAFEAYDIESKWNGIPVRSIFAWLEKQKEQKNTSASTMAPSCWEVEQKEQKPVKPFDDELQRYQDELHDFKVFVTKQAKEHDISISFVHDFEWNNFCAELLSYFNEQKPAEWSEDYREEDIQTRFAFYTYKDDSSVLYLSNVFVEEASRNHGFGTKILRAAEKVAETIGATTISLKVKQDSPANAWYRKNGYGYVAFEDGYDWLEKNLEYMKSNKQEWSEEDEKLLNKVEVLLDDYCDFLEDENSRFIPEVRETISRLKSLRPQPKDEIYKEKDEAFKLGKHQLAIKFMNYLDENRPEGKMSLSNAECEDIDKAFKENDWERIMRYVNKYAWKPSKEQVEALEDTMTYIPEYYKPKSNLASLLRDLKKQV